MVSGLKRLSDREARQVLVRCHLLFDVHYCRQRRPLPQPGTERIERIAKSLWPFLIAEVLILVLIAYWSDLTLFVPRLLGLVD